MAEEQNKGVRPPAEKDFRATFECLGLEPGVDTGDGQNVRCECPFCEKPGHFYLNIRTGQWDCKVCGRQGNHLDFLRDVSNFMEDWTILHPEKWNELAHDRGIPADVFKELQVVWNFRTNEWIFPVYSPTATVRDVRRWYGRGIMSTEGCNVQLAGLYRLANVKDRHKRRIWICEGEWDGMAMHWMLQAAGSGDLCVAVPGAGTFKKEWIPYFQDCHVVFVYDNDDSGDKGSSKASKLLQGITRKQQFICWPETFKSGYDLRDHVKDGRAAGAEPLVILTELEALLRNQHRRSLTGDATVPSTLDREVGPPCSFNEVVDVFKRHVKIDADFMDCLRLALAVPLSNQMPGEPLWYYVIGPSGGGKTLILGSLATTPVCSFHSKITGKTLVSGFARDPDPSILPKLNGLTAVFKDGTTILAMHPDERRELYSIFREAYDGRVDAHYGNGVIRRYEDLHFNVLIGVTPAIRTENQSAVGERFLAIELRENLASLNDKLYQCVANTSKEKQMNDELSNICARFLNREIDLDNLPKIPEPHVHRLVAMAQLIAVLRATVERDPRDKDLKYRAVSETGTRVVKQLAKTAIVLAIQAGKAEVDNDVCRLLRKVMVDTCIGFHIDVVKTFVRNQNRPMSASELATLSQIDYVTLNKRLGDMTVLRILDQQTTQPEGRFGVPTQSYRVSERVWNLWHQALDGVPRGT